MSNKRCDLTNVRSETMRLAQAGAKKLKQSGIPVTTEVFAELVRDAHRKAIQACQPANLEVTPEQAKVVADLCEPCSRFYTVKAKGVIGNGSDNGKQG